MALTEHARTAVIHELECLRCGHKWYPKLPKIPQTCAACKSRIWDQPKSEKRTA